MQPWTSAMTSATCFCLASLKYTNTQILVYLYLYLYLCICLASLPSTSPPPSLLNESLYSELYDHPANCVLSNFNEILFEKLWYSEQRTNQPTTNAYVIIWRKRGKCCSQDVKQDLLWTTFQKVTLMASPQALVIGFDPQKKWSSIPHNFDIHIQRDLDQRLVEILWDPDRMRSERDLHKSYYMLLYMYSPAV